MHCSHFGLHKSGTFNDIIMNSNCWGWFHALLLQLKLLGLISVLNAVATVVEGALPSQRTVTSMEKQCRSVINVMGGVFECIYVSFQCRREQVKDGYQT